jgi:hypothetical protein
MLDWSHGGGFSVDASVRIAAADRRGRERLLRYCARPLFAQERLSWAGEHHDRLVYRLPKPMPDGRAILYLTPLELLDRLAQIILHQRGFLRMGERQLLAESGRSQSLIRDALTPDRRPVCLPPSCDFSEVLRVKWVRYFERMWVKVRERWI